MSFLPVFNQYTWSKISEAIYSSTQEDVERALKKKKRRSWQDFMALVSPAAKPYLEAMAQLSHQITLKRFGRTIQLYVPMYLSNKCHNVCTYCGFSAKNKIKRLSLDPQQILEEAQALAKFHHQHLLLVTGETRKIGPNYISDALDIVAPLFASLSIETQAFEQQEYEQLRSRGLNSVYLYQETYNKTRYGHYHKSGTKADFEHRLLVQDEMGAAEIHKCGLGVLLGLEDWRTDSCFLALHLSYLEKHYWKTRYSVSFPRLREAEGNTVNSTISDHDLVQLICAYRIFNENIEMCLSTRESQTFRNHAVKLGITSMSADSKTAPGAYTLGEALEQFSISDERKAGEIADMLHNQGYEAVWKDWDPALSNQ